MVLAAPATHRSWQIGRQASRATGRRAGQALTLRHALLMRQLLHSGLELLEPNLAGALQHRRQVAMQQGAIRVYAEAALPAPPAGRRVREQRARPACACSSSPPPSKTLPPSCSRPPTRGWALAMNARSAAVLDRRASITPLSRHSFTNCLLSISATRACTGQSDADGQHDKQQG